MDVIEQIKKSVAIYLKDNHGESVELDKLQVDPTRKEFDGDYTLVVFPFVKIMRTRPEDAGEKLGAYLTEQLDAISDYNVIKGFLNLTLTSNYWGEVLQQKLSDDKWLAEIPSNNLVMVEFSSPNTNKPLHLGHLRNNFLGYSVSLMKAFNGEKVIKTQIVNDRGVHICKSMLAWKRFGNGETPESKGIKGDKLVGQYYVIFDQHYREEIRKLVEQGMDEEQAKKEAPLIKEVQEMLVKWEQGDAATIKLWETMNSWVYEGFDQTYDRMGVEFDKLYYESSTYLKGKDIVQNGLEKELFFKKDNGSVWADLTSNELDEKLLLRSDGTTVYMTQDIGTAVQRYEDYPELKQIVYTVGDEQDYHFKVLFLILEKLGYPFAASCRHLSYGMVDLPSGKMKSREGTVVDADELMEEVVKAAKDSSEEKGKLDEMDANEQHALFEMLGIGALKFYLLRVDPRKRMLFDPQESVSLNGDTGPFVQYTHARCRAVLRKADSIELNTYPQEIADKERALLKMLVDFRNIAQTAAEDMNPSIIANYCLDLAKLYNQFYHESPILKAKGDLKAFRIGLTKLTAETIRTSMSLLSINVPERM